MAGWYNSRTGLACEVDNLKTVEVVTVAHVDDEDRVGKSSLQNWELSFGHKAKLFFRLWFEHKVWSRFWSLCLVKILKMKFNQVLCLNLWHDPLGYFGQLKSTLGSVLPLAMFKLWRSNSRYSKWILRQMRANWPYKQIINNNTSQGVSEKSLLQHWLFINTLNVHTCAQALRPLPENHRCEI